MSDNNSRLLTQNAGESTQTKIFDLHNDYLTANPDERKLCGMSDDILIAGRQIMTGSIIFAVWATRLGLNEKSYFSFVSTSPQFSCRTFTAIEDLGGIDIVDYDEFLVRANLMYASLTWNGENVLAGGVGSEKGLTGRGVSALAAIRRHVKALDLAHLNEKSFWEVLKKYDGKLLVSHTGAREVLNNPRNLSREQINAVAERKGIIGLFAAADFISDNCNRNNFIRHIAAVCDCAGTECVAIGTDFCGASKYPAGLETYADFECLQSDMLAFGFTITEIEQIFYKNAEGFFGVRENE